MTRILVASLLGLALPVLATPAAPAPEPLPLPVMIPRVVTWAEGLAARALQAGTPPGPELQAIAREVGVKSPRSIRIWLVDSIPLPEEPLLKAAALKAGISSERAGAMTLGYAVLLRRGEEGDLRLLRHELRHVAQYEQAGGIGPFLAIHLPQLSRYGYEDAPFERDARRHER